MRHLSFALDICNGGIFEDKMDIWHSEVVEGRTACETSNTGAS
jgi:hypothetical protein